MKESKTQPLLTERPFRYDELFFSTTDSRGILNSFNEVFVRVSGFTADQLFNKPHNIIRHPDMPRCIFKLLWDYLLAGKEIAAYVKNMAINGEYYWVLAHVTPIKDGFLSIRLKPSSEWFSAIQPLYKTLLETEKSAQDWRVGMDRSYQQLEQTVHTLGFASYDALMHKFLREELKSRSKLLLGMESTATEKDASNSINTEDQRSLSLYNKRSSFQVVFKELDQLADLNSTLTSKSAKLARLTDEMRFLATNASIKATKLGQIGDTLGIVADFMAQGAQQVTRNFADLGVILKEAEKSIGEVSALTAVGQFQAEMAISYSMETFSKIGSSGSNSDNMSAQALNLLETEVDERISALSQRLTALKEVLNRAIPCTEYLYKNVQALKFVYYCGRIESEATGTQNALAGVFTTLWKQVSSSRDELDEIDSSIKKVLGNLAKSHESYEQMISGGL